MPTHTPVTPASTHACDHANTRLGSHGATCHPSLPQLDALATLVSTKCLAAFSPLGGSTREVAVDVDALDMACWTELMRLVSDPDKIPASSAAARAVVRLKMVDRTRKHIWDTTEKKEKNDADSLADHVCHPAHEASLLTPGPWLQPAARHLAPRSEPRFDAPQPAAPDPEQVRFVAKPLETDSHVAKYSDPGRRYLRDGVSSREDVPAQFARAWGTRISPATDPLGLVRRLCTPAHPHPCTPTPLHTHTLHTHTLHTHTLHTHTLHRCIPAPQVSSLVTASLDNYQHRGAAQAAHVMLLAVAFDASRGACCLLPPYPHPTPTLPPPPLTRTLNLPTPP